MTFFFEHFVTLSWVLIKYNSQIIQPIKTDQTQTLIFY